MAESNGCKALAAWLEWTGRLFLDVPNVDLMTEVDRLPSPDLLPSRVAEQEACRVRDMATAVGNDLALLRNASLDFTQLFCACREGAPYPYESVYCGVDRLLMRPIRDEVVCAYDVAGFSPSAVCPTEPEDHLGVEMAYTAHLVREGRAKELAAFVQDHANWTVRFADEVRAQEEGEFYSAAAQLARALLNDAACC